MSHIESKLTREQAIMLASDLSGGQKDIVRLVGQAFDKTIPEGHEWEEWNTDEVELTEIFSWVMRDCKRAVSIDWASPIRDAADDFAKLLKSVGIDPAPARAEIRRLPVQSLRGTGTGIAYVPFRKLADENGMRILDIYEGSDEYRLVIVANEVAERWIGVQLDDTGYVGDADHQFSGALEDAGITPRRMPDEAPPAPEVSAETAPSA